MTKKVKEYLQNLRSEGLKGYFKERKALYICIGLTTIPGILMSIFVGMSHPDWVSWNYIESVLGNILEGIALYFLYRLFRRWRYGKELEEWKKKEATAEYQEWFESLTPEEQMVELQKKNNIIAEQTMKTSKTTTAASVFTAGAAGTIAAETADVAKKVVKVVKK